MAKSLHRKAPRINPFWAYRDPLSGRWVTVMSSLQCQQVIQKQAFTPQTRQGYAAQQNSA